MAVVAAGIIHAAGLEGLQSGLTAMQQRLDVLKSDINEALPEVQGDPSGEPARRADQNSATWETSPLHLLRSVTAS